MKLFGNTFKILLGATFALGTTLGTANAATIVPVSVSSPDAFCCTRAPIRTIDGSGLNGFGEHSNGNSDNISWQAEGTLTPTITWDLGAAYDLTAMHVWNYNEINRTWNGVNEVDIFVSLDDVSYASLGQTTLSEASGSSNYLGLDYALSATARYVRFGVLSNYDPSGTFRETFDNGALRVGLAEIRFEGTATPEPSTFVLVGVSAAVLGIARRKKTSL